MTKLTRAQRVALKRVYDRALIYPTVQGYAALAASQAAPLTQTVTYLQFRKTVRGTFGLDGAVVVPWAGMFLLIETDGYTHS